MRYREDSEESRGNRAEEDHLKAVVPEKVSQN